MAGEKEGVKMGAVPYCGTGDLFQSLKCATPECFLKFSAH